MLKFLVLLFAGGLYSVASLPAYSSKYDNVDIDKILSNDRLLNGYINCLLDTGGCTPEGKDLKVALPDGLKSNCAECSEKQRLGIKKVVAFLIDKKAEQWAALERKYDPSGIYRKRYETELRTL